MRLTSSRDARRGRAARRPRPHRPGRPWPGSTCSPACSASPTPSTTRPAGPWSTTSCPPDELVNAVGLNSTLITVGPDRRPGHRRRPHRDGRHRLVLRPQRPVVRQRPRRRCGCMDWRIAAPHARPSPRAKGQLREGFRYAMSVDDLRIPLLLMAVVGTLSFNYVVLLPLLAERDLGGSDVTYTVLTAFFGVGSLIGSLRMARRARSTPASWAASAIVLGLTSVALAVAPTVAAAGAVLVVAGYAGIGVLSGGNALLQIAVDPAMRGRVLALYTVVFLGLDPDRRPDRRLDRRARTAPPPASCLGRRRRRWPPAPSCSPSSAAGSAGAARPGAGRARRGLAARTGRPRRLSRRPEARSRRRAGPGTIEEHERRTCAHLQPQGERDPAGLARRRRRGPRARPRRDRGRPDPAGQAQADLRPPPRHRRLRHHRQRRQDRPHRRTRPTRSSSAATPATPAA